MFISKFGLELKHANTGYLTRFEDQFEIQPNINPNALVAAINAYINIINNDYEDLLIKPGFDTAIMSAETLEELTMPFSDWLYAKNLQSLIPFFTRPLSYYGYGLLTQIPAMYAIKCMNEKNTKSMLAYGFFGSNASVDDIAKIVGGFERLVEAIADDLEDVHLSADVSIARPQDAGSDSEEDEDSDDDESAILKYTDDNGTEHIFSCGYIIAAFPQKSSLMDFMGLDNREQSIFAKPFTQNYFTSSVHGLRDPEGEELPNGSYFNVNFAFATDWDGSTVLFSKPYDDVDYVTLFQYAMPESPLRDEDIRDLVKEDMESYGLDKDNIENFNRWMYFPAVTPEDIIDGFYEDLDALQGYRNTFYTGGLLNFEVVENVIAYSKYLVETYFPDETSD